MELWTAHAKKQYETFTAHAKELAELSQKVATETAEPIKANASKLFKPRRLIARLLIQKSPGRRPGLFVCGGRLSQAGLPFPTGAVTASP